MANFIVQNFAGYGTNQIVEVEPSDVPITGDIEACNMGINTGYGGIKRLTATEYNNLINDLFADTRDFTDNFVADKKVGNFSFNTKFAMSEQQVQQYINTAKNIAEEAVKNQMPWMGCELSQGPSIVPDTDQCNSTNDCKNTYGDSATDCKGSQASDSVCMCGDQPCYDPSQASAGPAPEDDAACIEKVLTDIVPRAYRRLLTQDERNALMALYQQGASEGTPTEGLKVMLQAVLSSPYFIYHIEFGEDLNSNGVRPLTQYELASRLSFYLWRAAPDTTLLSAAAAGELKTDAQITAQVNRLIDHPRGREVIKLFHKEWMHLLKPIKGDDAEALTEAANQDTLLTIQSLVFDDNATFEDLFNVSHGYLNAETKALYGVDGTAETTEQDGYARYQLDPSRRTGLLARAGFLNSNTPPSGRGKFIREELLCGSVPPPPADVDTDLKNDDPDASPREKWESHIADPSCGGCHILLDPLGFAFDHYDHSGKWRDVLTSISGKEFPIIDHGEVVATSDMNGYFDGGQELQGLLAKSEDTRGCYTQQWFRFATGRTPSKEDACSLAVANQLAEKTQYTIRDIIVAIALTDAFRHIRTEKPAAEQ